MPAYILSQFIKLCHSLVYKFSKYFYFCKLATLLDKVVIKFPNNYRYYCFQYLEINCLFILFVFYFLTYIIVQRKYGDRSYIHLEFLYSNIKQRFLQICSSSVQTTNLILTKFASNVHFRSSYTVETPLTETKEAGGISVNSIY